MTNELTTRAVLETPWQDLTFVGFDTETTGRYPLTAEICEIGAVKWRAGRVIGQYSTLIKPSQPMGAEVIAIHGITNEMVESAPAMKDKIREFHAFIQDAILVVHHAPFDLGFIAVEFERFGLSLPTLPVVCSSLLSRKVFSEGPLNHKLQTLIPFFGLDQGQAHRAGDDARACLEVAVRCMEKIGAVPLAEIMAAQGGALSWQRFSMRELEERDTTGAVVQASREGGEIEFAYGAGSKPGQKRRIHPLGVVRSLDGDFFVGQEEEGRQAKRFYLDKVLSSTRIV